MDISDISFKFSRVLESEIGLTVSLIGYLVVFISLIALYLVFKNLQRVVAFRFKKEEKMEVAVAKESRLKMDISGEMNAAIGTAIHLYFNELHDEENFTLTINRVSKRYTPWNSKIYGIIKDLNRRF